MYQYTPTQWILFFMIYCFAGWVFESIYVSLHEKRLVNRGFLNGPVIPIYGCGALTMLFAGLPFIKMPALVFLAGMIAASAMEYVTGAAMEAIFKVRYWDYSDRKFNLNGHICLAASLLWGFFSLLLIYVLHEPVAGLVEKLPDHTAHVISAAFIMVFSVDFAMSLRTALDIRALIIQAERMREEMERMRRRVEIMDTFYRQDLQDRKQELIDRLESAAALPKEVSARAVKATRTRFMETYHELLSMTERVRSHMDIEPPIPTLAGKRAEWAEELGQIKARMENFSDRLHKSISKDKIRLIRRYPTAVLPDFLKEALKNADSNEN